MDRSDLHPILLDVMRTNAGTAVAYESLMGRWSRLAARQFLDWLAMPAGRRWLDVGCGTGALTRAILEQAKPAAVWSIDPDAEYVAYLRSASSNRAARVIVADGEALPFGAPRFEAVVSGLALNQIAEPANGLAEMMRVARPGATLAAYVWDFREGIQLLRRLWDTAAQVDGESRSLDPAFHYPLCRPGPLRRLFEGSGLKAVRVEPLSVPTVFRSFDDYWSPFLSGVGRAAGYVVSLSPLMREALRKRLEEALPAREDGSIVLEARAWAVSGTR